MPLRGCNHPAQIFWLATSNRIMPNRAQGYASVQGQSSNQSRRLWSVFVAAFLFPTEGTQSENPSQDKPTPASPTRAGSDRFRGEDGVIRGLDHTRQRGG